MTARDNIVIYTVTLKMGFGFLFLSDILTSRLEDIFPSRFSVSTRGICAARRRRFVASPPPPQIRLTAASEPGLELYGFLILSSVGLSPASSCQRTAHFFSLSAVQYSNTKNV